MLHRKGQSLGDVAEAIGHGDVAASEHSYPFTPACGDVDQLDAMYIVTLGAGAPVVDQVCLQVTRFCLLPGDTLHWDGLAGTVGLLGPSPRQAIVILANSFQDTTDCGGADRCQIIQQTR